MVSAHICIVGAGHMGRSALAILAGHDERFRFTVVDRSAANLEVAAATAPGRVELRRADIAREEPPLGGADIVLNVAGPFFEASTRVAEAAIAQGVPYIDIADDVEAALAILALDALARSRGTFAVTGAGNSPGISNWLAGELIADHPETDEIRVAWLTHEPDPGGLAPLKHMLHMAVHPALNLVDGELAESPGFRPETARSYRFPAPIGEVEAYDTAHPEPFVLSRAHPQLRHVSCQGILQPHWANAAFSTLGRIGFGYSDVEVRLGDRVVDPAEVLWEMMWARHRARSGGAAVQPVTAVRVEAFREGGMLGARTVVDDHVMGLSTGIGAAAAVLTALAGEVAPGAHGPEALDHATALVHVAELSRRLGAFQEGIIRS